MVDVEDDHRVVRIVDAVADSVLASARPPHPFEWRLQRNADHSRSEAERPADELPGSKGCDGWKGLAQCSARTRREAYCVRGFIRRLSRHGDRAADVRP